MYVISRKIQHSNEVGQFSTDFDISNEIHIPSFLLRNDIFEG